MSAATGTRRGAWRAAAVAVAVAVVTAGCFSAFNPTRYRSAAWNAAAVKTVAVLPLLVQSAAQTEASVSWSPGWLTEYSVTAPLSPAQYEPAAATWLEGLRRALAGPRLVTPEEVNAAMGEARVAKVEAAVVEVARRVGADAVVVFELRDFRTKTAGLTNAEARGRTDVACYAASGKLLWTVSAEVVKGPVGSNAAPSLAQFMEYAMARLEPELRAMMR